MSIVGLLLFVLIGALVGVVAELLVGFTPGGFVASVVVGFVGAWLGGVVARFLGLPSALVVAVDGRSVDLLWAVLGSVLLLGVLSLFRRAAYRSPS